MTRPFLKFATAVSERHRSLHRARKSGLAIAPAEREPENPKLSLRNVSLSYETNKGKQLTALRNINLQVQPGEFLCVVGPSGCGKSTLLH